MTGTFAPRALNSCSEVNNVTHPISDVARGAGGAYLGHKSPTAIRSSPPSAQQAESSSPKRSITPRGRVREGVRHPIPFKRHSSGGAARARAQRRVQQRNGFGYRSLALSP